MAIFTNLFIFLFFSPLIKISLDTPDFSDTVIPVTNNATSIVAVDYDPVEQKIYWTDQSAGINRASVHDGLNQEQVVTKELNTTDGMAVDYNGRNIFWTDTGMNRIEVERMDGTYRKILISHGLDEPRDISLGMYRMYSN